jgi:hypothetical protein
VRRLVKAKKMTRFGLESIQHHMGNNPKNSSALHTLKNFTLPKDILKILQSNPIVWKNFKTFPESYKRIRIGWIDTARHRPEIFNQRLQYFIKATKKNKRFGMVQ